MSLRSVFYGWRWRRLVGNYFLWVIKPCMTCTLLTALALSLITATLYPKLQGNWTSVCSYKLPWFLDSSVHTPSSVAKLSFYTSPLHSHPGPPFQSSFFIQFIFTQTSGFRLYVPLLGPLCFVLQNILYWLAIPIPIVFWILCILNCSYWSFRVKYMVCHTVVTQ